MSTTDSGNSQRADRAHPVSAVPALLLALFDVLPEEQRKAVATLYAIHREQMYRRHVHEVGAMIEERVRRG